MFDELIAIVVDWSISEAPALIEGGLWVAGGCFALVALMWIIPAIEWFDKEDDPIGAPLTDAQVETMMREDHARKKRSMDRFKEDQRNRYNRSIRLARINRDYNTLAEFYASTDDNGQERTPD